MLDQSRTPTKAAFLFGPPRSGKSTFLRTIKQIAGETNCSAVDLHQLAYDKFTAAHLRGKMVNLSADPSSKDVADTLLPEGLTEADRAAVETWPPELRSWLHDRALTRQILPWRGSMLTTSCRDRGPS
ncbi:MULTISPECIES: DUF5906 domain-containing protein [Streptomyces]|nr:MULTISPECIES: DUF5906 domain-containing protein [Streptomyces]